MTEILTPTNRSVQLEQLRAIVADVLEIEPAELSDASSFVDDHGADSLMAIEILARLERDLGVQIPQDELSELTDLTSVHRVVTAHSAVAVSDD
jgi:acyl carrier protein